MMMSLRILDPNITILGLVIIRYHLFISAFCWIRSPVIKVIFAVFVLLRTPRLNAAYQKCSENLCAQSKGTADDSCVWCGSDVDGACVEASYVADVGLCNLVSDVDGACVEASY